MALKGRLEEMALPNIIQVSCMEGSQARLLLSRDNQGSEEEAMLYFADGQVVHAVWDDCLGAEAVYELLKWENGAFELQNGVTSPDHTITASWSALLLEGARRIDEGSEFDLSELTPTNGTNLSTERKAMAAKKRSEILMETLSNLLASSTDIEGAVVVSNDGLVMASHLPKGADETRIGASAAALMGLNKRTLPALGRGSFTQSLIQGDQGNIIITNAGERAVLVGLTPQDVNLGMIFLEARDAASMIAKAL